MSFKIHLLIVTCIIAAVFIIWQLMQTTTDTSKASDSKGITHVIAITHASLGLNCRELAINNDTTPRDAFGNMKVNPKLMEDNVFGAVSLKCNGSTQCEVFVDSPELGVDPAPECNPKTLEVEYRCFSYDRPWRVKATSGSIKLLCGSEKK